MMAVAPRPIALVMIAACMAIPLELACAAGQPVAGTVGPDTASQRQADHAAEERRLSEALVDEPDNVQLRFQRAQLRSRIGENQAALADYDALIKRFPHDVDYRFGRGNILGRLGRDQEALEDLALAVELAPDYEDVWALRYRLALRQPDNAEQILQLRAQSEARFPLADWWQALPPETPNASRMTLLVGSSIDDLNNGLPGWNEQFAEIGFVADDRWTLSARAARAQRFRASDVAVSVGAELRVDDRWEAGLNVGATPDAEFYARRQLRAHLLRRLPSAWSVDLAYGRREFATATVSLWQLTTEKYFGDYRAAHTLTVARLHGATTSVGHSVSLTRYWSERLSLGIGIAVGDEAEVIAPGQVLETDVSAMTLNGRYRICERLSLSAWLGVQEQGDFYRRQYAGLAVSVGL